MRTCCECGCDVLYPARKCDGCRKPVYTGPVGRYGDELNSREKQIARLVSQAKLNKEIAHELQLTEGTIKEYMNRIFRKTGFSNRTELAVWFVRRGNETHGQL